MLGLDNTGEKFTQIYKDNLWRSDESRNGSGSEYIATRSVVKELPKLCVNYEISSILDAPCGDFNWMKEIVGNVPNLKYIGGDIVREPIQHNRIQTQLKNCSFLELDITKDELPSVDLMLVRDCFIHLSYSDISRFLINFKKSKIKYLLTTAYIDKSILNEDIATGDARYFNLFSAPLNFTNSIYSFADGHPDEPPKELHLFRNEDVPSKLFL